MLAIVESNMTPGLRDLNLKRSQVTDTGCTWLAERCTSLLKLNITAPYKINPNEKLAVIRRIEGSDIVYSLGHNNFYTITRYNRSRLYALAVHTLAKEIKVRP